jgi:ATP-binding cassette subfamily F protein 3
MLHINEITFRYGGRIILQGATAHVPAGQKVGLVGRNGVGKTTLFKLILGELAADDGSLSLRARARVGTVAQEAPAGDFSLLECVLAADLERSELLAQSETETDGSKLGEIHERLTAIDAHTGPARAGAILAGLGFDAEAQARPVTSFSGGWRMRVALAGVLFARPDLLLLDEPTNHLDLEATLWLQSYLTDFPGTLIVISHDREILNQVCNRIIHVDQARLASYSGNYDTFEKTRRAKFDLAAKAASKQIEQRKKIQGFIDRFKAKASKARQAQSRVKMLERMGPVVSVIEDRGIEFDFPDPQPLSPPILTIENGTAGYAPGKPVLRKLDIRIDMEDRIALLGANGNGKSTLAKVLSGRLNLLTGTMRASSKLKIGYFAQHQTDELIPSRTPYHHMAELMGRLVPEMKVRAQLGRFGFQQQRADVPVSSLSGGEKARLLLALATRDAPHLLILDEPTNHLDIDSREALVQALNAYEGAVILISHDPHLVGLTADSLWLVGDGVVQPFEGDIDDYRRMLLEQGRGAKREKLSSAEKANRRDNRRNAAESRAQAAPLRRAVKDAEALVESLTRKCAEMDAKLADPTLYSATGPELPQLQKNRAALLAQLNAAETAWLSAQEALDQAQADEG